MNQLGINCRQREGGRLESATPVDPIVLRAALNRFPRLPLGEFPTPIREMVLSGGGRFWIKNDGICSKIYGGNKVRKLEYLLAEVPKLSKAILVVHGDIESHTVQACSLMGRQAGLEVHAVVFPHRGQSVEAKELANLRQADVFVHLDKSMLAAFLHAHWIGWRKNAVVVPLGASAPTTNLGYVRAALELVDQVRQGQLPEPRHIYIPFATGGTVAGLLIGLALSGSTTRVVAVQTVEKVIANRRRLERLVKSTLAVLGFGRREFELCMHQLELIDQSQLGRGYRDATSSVHQAVALAGQHGLGLEPVFSGKAFAALLQALPEFPNGELLFWNTHDQSMGLPAKGTP